MAGVVDIGRFHDGLFSRNAFRVSRAMMEMEGITLHDRVGGGGVIITE